MPASAAGPERPPCAHGLICPEPRTRYLKLVSCSTPTGPRAWKRPVAMPISAPKPNSPPSANWVEALCRTMALSTSCRNFSAAALILGHDRVGVMRAVALDMPDRGVHAVDHLGGDDGVEIFGRPVLLARRLHARIDGARRLVAAHLAAGIEQHGDERLEMRRRRRAIDQQRLGRAADAGAPHLGVEHDASSPCRAWPPCPHRRGRCPRDARTPARAPPPARARPGSCRRAGRSRRWRRRARRASSRPRRGRASAPARWRLRQRGRRAGPRSARHESRGSSGGSPSRRAGSPHCRP